MVKHSLNKMLADSSVPAVVLGAKAISIPGPRLGLAEGQGKKQEDRQPQCQVMHAKMNQGRI